jgi:carboxypeptidase C (cathepsin A)
MTMLRCMRTATLALVLNAAAVTVALAQAAPPPPLAPLAMAARGGTHVFTSEHRGTFNGREVAYRATVADARIEYPVGHPAATLFTISYVATNQGPPASRPVVFIFNGGPGASSSILHFAGMGPRRLSTVSPDALGDTSVGLIENPLCPLDAADIVFIDPVDTGYSRTLPGASPAPFHSIDGDSDSITQLILNWLKRNDRMASPKYIYGESYGSMRAVALARDLARSPDKVDVDGLILGGEAITFGQRGRLPNPAHAASHLPMMASVAWYHGRIDNKHQSWEQAVQKAREFARGEYVGALMQGYRLDQQASRSDRHTRQLLPRAQDDRGRGLQQGAAARSRPGARCQQRHGDAASREVQVRRRHRLHRHGGRRHEELRGVCTHGARGQRPR